MNVGNTLFIAVGVCCVAFLSGCAGSNTPTSHMVEPESSLMLVYLRPTNFYYPKKEMAIIAPYKAALAKLPTNQAMQDALHSVANDIPWIAGMQVGNYLKKGLGGIDLHKYWRLSHDADYDGIVSVQPTVELTPGLKGVLLVAIVSVQKNVSSVPVMLKTTNITETVSLENAGAPLPSDQMEAINSNDSEAAVRARAKIWFAKGGHRLENAMLFDLRVMTQNLRKFLSHPD